MIIQFDAFVAKHGEVGAQALVENWEQYRGIRHTAPLPLEHRWEMFINATAEPARKAA